MSLLKSMHMLKVAQKYANIYSTTYHPYSSNRAKESFLSGTNANFLENQYIDWANSKGSIDSSWDTFYDSLCGPALKIEDVQDEYAPRKTSSKDKSSTAGQDVSLEKIKLHLAVQNLIRSYQCRGHLLAKTDPLELTLPARMLKKGKKMSLDAKGLESIMVARELGSSLSEKHMDIVFTLPERTFIGGKEQALTLREIIHRLEYVYCGSIGVEYMHLYDLDAVQYVRKRMETPGSFDKDPEEKKLIMKRLTKAVFLEKYFATKWPAEKRFGLEGGESMIVMLEEIVDTGSRLGIQSIIIGMQHRGRLNMLVNVCRKKMVDIFAQFKPMEPKEPGSGDIKYHLGTYIHRFIRRTNKYIKVSMSANPSHLEVVGPVVAGKAKAEQFWKGDNGEKVMVIIMHGDAAMAGQGVVYETAGQTNLPAFTTHGCLHIVCNNQIGYTTDPRFSRSTPYCTDVGKAIDAPIFHVNGDDGEAVAHAARIAIEYRCKFKKDVMLDLVCYRRHGHSEEDEPMYTQPFMYKKIKSMPTVDIIYADKLKAEGIANDADIKMWQKEYMDTLNEHFELAKKVTKLSIMDWVDTPWTGFFEATDPNKVKETGINQTSLMTIANHFAAPPEKWAFELHKGLDRMLAAREKLIKEGVADWALGEALAFGSLLRDQIHIRFTGEDVERGTMAHRHHVYHHQGVDGATYRVLDCLYPDQAKYELHNSSLSEFGIMGFEVGYSYSSPHLLTIWEAQYGDFADTGQPVFDTFVANAESKWICQSGIVIQLPHGLDGAGPEHSSGRVERHLAQCDDDEDVIPNLDDPLMALKQLRGANWIIANVTSASNYFHLIRRQVAMPFRKPLILFTPKVGLKHPYYRSKFSEFLLGTEFRRVISDQGPASKDPKGVKKLIFCSGNVAIKIDDAIKEKKCEKDIAVCRIEQLYPFPYDLVLKEFCTYEHAKLCFCQEEHKNQGPWQFCRVRIENLLGKKIQSWLDHLYYGNKVYRSSVFSYVVGLQYDWDYLKKELSYDVNCSEEKLSQGSGDIKYHLGTYIHRFIRRTNKYIKVSMSANPSHLEVVGPVVAGKAKAEQFWKGDNGEKVMVIIMHGDAAMAGQGVVYETAGQTNLPAFTTHGCLHIVCNNQIGYTTDPRFSRSTPYCTDVGKAIDAPIFHVNGDDGEAVAHAARIAIEYRCKFKKDVMLDLVCYRRHGHSEEDEPMYTQPFMYKKIKSMPTVDIIYADKLKAEGIANDADIKMWQKEYMDNLNEHFELAKKVTKLSIMDWVDTPWTGFFEATDPNKVKETGINQTSLMTIANHFAAPPEKWAFELHKGLDRMLAAREKLIKEGVADWALGEALAFGSLLRDQIHIRFTGEDVERGTMAHRHHVYHHQGVDGATYRVLDCLYPDQAKYELHNSSLSEFGIMGFEVGYSYSSPHLLTIWEAQYGDFADTGQPVFDTFVANAESKWICQSGIVIQLPHGLDGAGPEHSSGRVERHLAQCDDDEDVIPNLDDPLMALKQLRGANWIIANVTSASNYFHLIRRQVAMPFRKPLILFTPKVGLKHPYYRSKFSEFLLGTEFRRVISDQGPASKDPKGVKKLIFCSGNVAIKIDDAIKEKKCEKDIAVCRIEQLYPFPYDLVLKEFCTYEHAKLCFCQEEHKNQGPWQFCRVRIENLLGKKIQYIGRPSSSASATGIKWLHNKELKELKEAIVTV